MNNKFFTLLLLMLLALLSCSEESVIQNPLPQQGPMMDEKSVMLKVSVPSKMHGGSTRSIGEIQENTIETLDVLAFKMEGSEEVFQYWTPGFKDSGNLEGSSSQSFSVKLRIRDHQQRFVVIANARSKIQELIVQANWGNANKEIMLSQLEENIVTTGRWNSTGASNYTALPMWGESNFMLIGSETTSMGTVSMLRMVAKIEVQIDSVANPLLKSKFKLKSVHIYNTNNIGRIVPKPGTTTVVDGYTKAVTPSIPASASIELGPLEYAQPHDFAWPGEPDVAMRGAIYLFERQAINISAFVLDETCIVVGGIYSNDAQPSYYRVDFVDQYEIYLDILRNHNYLCNLLDIKGRGYPTAFEAYMGKSYNIVANIVEWDNSVSTVAFDNHFTLSVSKDDFEFYREATTIELSNNVFYVSTDYVDPNPMSGLGWYVEKIVDRVSGEPVDWLEATPNQGASGTRAKVVLTYEANYTGEDRAAVLWIAAGRMRIQIQVSQSKYPPIKLELKDSTNRPIRELVFQSNSGDTPDAQKFTVSWEPYTFPVAVHSVNLVGKVPFDPASGIPTIDIPGGGVGEKTYHIQPPAISPTEIANDPFIEKASMVTFLVNNGPNNEAQSIFLRQLHYNLVVNKESSYLLDGGQHRFYVKSNADWRIKSIVETSSNPNRPLLDIQAGDNLRVGTLGGYNTLFGDPITFTVVNGGRSLWGKVDIVFENTDKLFSDKTVTLIFALPRVRVANFGTTGSSNNYNLNPTANKTNAGYMLTNGVNFGIDTASKVYSQGFGITFVSTANTITKARLDTTDIAVVVYDYRPTTGEAVVLANYVKNGGVLICMWEGVNAQGTSLDTLFREIFRTPSFPNPGISTTNSNPTNNRLLQLSSSIDDLITNGPFGNLRGLYVGTDAAGDRRVDLNSMPLGSFTLYADYTDYSQPSPTIVNNQSAILRLNDYAMIHICDGGFLGAGGTGNTGMPLNLDSSGEPTARNYGQNSNRKPAHNAALFGNMMVWAIGETGKKQPY